MTGPGEPKVRFNEKLDHLQARHPFPYNLATGVLIGLVLVLLGFAPLVGAIYAVVWAGVRAFLWGDGRILRRQYEARLVRVDQQRAERRRQR